MDLFGAIGFVLSTGEVWMISRIANRMSPARRATP